jgi:hypothetical protein
VEPRPSYGWDEAKRTLNRAKHKVDFTAVEGFDWRTAVVEVDDQEDYGELRERAIGWIGERLHVLIFTRRADLIWVIGLRKAQKSDARRYVEKSE